MAHLKDRTRQIPNGFTFIQPETGWKAPKWLSFDSLVREIISHRNGNQWAVTKHNLPTHWDEVADEVDRYNTKICESKGWTTYLSGEEGAPDPKYTPLPGLRPSFVAAGARLIAGVKTLRELFEGQPVAQELANTRAIQCSTCANNQPGDLTSFFTVPAAKLIKDHLTERKNMGLSTPSDPLLGVCIGCSCPLKLKVHTPLSAINHHMNEEIRAALVPECWVLHEK